VLFFAISIFFFIKNKVPYKKHLLPFVKNAIEISFAGVFSPLLFDIYEMFPKDTWLFVVAVLLICMPTITNILLHFTYLKKQKYKNITKRSYIVSCFYGCCLGVLGILTTALF
jgi:hypothetical protein